MKKIKIILAVFFISAFAGISAQTVDDIIKKNIEAMGGKAKMEALKTVKMQGTMSTPQVEIPITMTRSHMAGTRLDMEINGTSNYRIMNPTKGWEFMPIRGMTEPQEMEAEQLKAGYNQMDIQGALLNYKEKGTTIEMEGKEKTANAEVYKLKLTYKNGEVAHYLIDTKTNMLVGTKSKMSLNGQEMEISTSFSDFKQDQNGYWFPYTINTTQGILTFDKIETNIKVDDSLFRN